MLIINLNPQGTTDSSKFYPQHEVNWTAPILSVDGTPYDLSELPDGATALHPVLGTVERTGDDYAVTLRLPHGANAPYETRFPEPITVFADGPVTLPDYGEVTV